MDNNMPISSMFQHDNALCQRAKTVCAEIEELGLKLLPWPAQSPDLNPIENSWKVLKNRVFSEKYVNEDKLWQAVQKKWKEMTANGCENLVFSMRCRCQEIIREKAYPTHY